ncbi:MAG: polyribonucleotide nucleotidyltransferase [Flavobacteriales bacterium]|nr:polyribonucleotide nucleotidyltransferase [Flavobacteriales bacterium]|tara:strand:- start:5618 stop:7750 length:2133 start_codon:yes stop_codon:yes gene_type:complete
MIKEEKQIINLDQDREISISTGKLAKQAHGSVELRMGNTHLLATVVSSTDAKEGVDFLPLTVDYREKFSADGRFPGGFLKREARPTDQEILIMRLVDRILRPMFPSDYHADVQIMISLNSHDPNVKPDALAALAASTAITLSDIPFNGPISECRVARINGSFIINPSSEQLANADIDLMVGASLDSVAMVEGEMNEVSEDEMIEAIKIAHEAIKVQCEAQLKLAAKLGVKEKREYCHETHNEDLKEKIEKETYSSIYSVASEGLSKEERSFKFKKVKSDWIETLSEDQLEKYDPRLIDLYYHEVEKKAIRDLVLSEKIRLDGRKTTDIRPIWCEIDYLHSPHGSAVFTRGETQSLTTVTLGSATDVNRLDGVTYQGHEDFYLHYNFPPFSTGEARMKFSVSRREIGHGNLAQRALKKMIPSDNPYTVRIVSDILESNGSSSMATVCAGTLALMDAGIKIQKPVSGIAMGLISDEKNPDNYAVLSDILGDEDHLGDMDFKVCGTIDGITACQMDIKIQGLSYEILSKALSQAKEGRLHILNKITETISEPRAKLKPQTPKIIVLNVPKSTIGGIIGPGGKIIQELQASTETNISIEEVDDIGVVEILGTDQEKINLAVEKIKSIAFVPEIGAIYKGKVKSIMPYGAFIGISANTDGLVHISELSWDRVDKVEDILSEGDTLEVKLIAIDEKSGKLKLSRKVLLEKPQKEKK